LTVSKKSAYSTLYEILESLSKTLAPFLPFFAEEMYRILVKSQKNGKESVHLEQYPQPQTELIQPDIEDKVNIAREVITNGRSIRAKKDLKVRWPLQQVVIVTNDTGKTAINEFKDLILQELNVKTLDFSDDPLAFQDIEFAPNFKQLGPKFKKEANNVATWMKSQKGFVAKEIAGELNQKGSYSAEINGNLVDISDDDLEVRITEKEGFSGTSFKEGDLFLNLQLNEKLTNEGFVRDLIRRIQSMRKDLELAYDTEIVVYLSEIESSTKDVIMEYSSLIQEEVLATELNFSTVKEGFEKNWAIQDPEGNTRNITITILS
jgi:isoleucyl-tRNA synthetase